MNDQPDQPDQPEPPRLMAFALSPEQMAEMRAQHQAQMEVAEKLRIRFDSILQRFRIKMHLLTEGTNGLDGIGEQEYLIAVKTFHELQIKLMGLSSGFSTKTRETITSALREILDFVDQAPSCPACGGGDTCEVMVEEAEAEIRAEIQAEETREVMAEEAAAEEAAAEEAAAEDEYTWATSGNPRETLIRKLEAAGIEYTFGPESPVLRTNVILSMPRSTDAIRAFPAFLAELMDEFGGFFDFNTHGNHQDGK